MKKKISVALSEELLKMIDHLLKNSSRSEVIEEALIFYFKNHRALERDKFDLAILNKLSGKLNNENLDALKFQTPI